MSVTTTGHTLKKFDEELATLRDLVMSMGGSVEEQLRRAVDALGQGDAVAADEVVRRDRDIDRMELRADEEVAQVLALRAPLGIDLRTVLTLSKTVNDLERIGDEAKKIAKIARRLHGDASTPRLPLLDGIAALSTQALSMLRSALDALVRLDVERARGIGGEDDALDADYKAMLARLKAHMAAQPESIDAVVQLIFAVKAIERVGDHASNIAEYVFYLVEGRDVRHPKANPASERS